MWRYVAKSTVFPMEGHSKTSLVPPHEPGHQQSVMEFRNDGLAITPLNFFLNIIVWKRMEKVCPFKYCYLGYLCQISGCTLVERRFSVQMPSLTTPRDMDVIMSGIWFRNLPLMQRYNRPGMIRAPTCSRRCWCFIHLIRFALGISKPW